MNVSQEYRERVRTTHRRDVRVTLASGETLPVHKGTVNHGLGDASNAENVRSATLTVPGYDWAPETVTAPLSPYRGQRVRIEIGVETSTGFEYADHGWLDLVDVEVDRPSGGVEVTLVDLAWRVDQVALNRLRSLTRTSARAQIVALVQEATGTAPTVDRDDSNNASVPADFVEKEYGVTDSLWTMCKDAAAAVDCTVGFNAAGNLEVVSTAIAGAPVDRVAVGEVITGYTSEAGVTDDFANVFVSRLENQAQTAFIGTATVPAANPLHPSKIGLYRRGENLSGLLSVSQAAANKRAQNSLNASLRRTREIALDTTPLPHLEAGDIVEVRLVGGSFIGRIQTASHGLAANEASKVTVRWEPDGQIVMPRSLTSNDVQDGEIVT